MLPGPDDPVDPLWLKAVEVTGAGPKWPERWTETEERLDAEGKVVSSAHRDVDGKAAFAGTDPFGLGGEADNPFRKDLQGKVEPYRLNRTRLVGERDVAALAYTQNTADGRWAGTAWIDVETGVPRELQRRRLATGAAPQLDVTVRYTADAKDWRPVEVETETQVAEGGRTLRVKRVLKPAPPAKKDGPAR